MHRLPRQEGGQLEQFKLMQDRYLAWGGRYFACGLCLVKDGWEIQKAGPILMHDA